MESSRVEAGAVLRWRHDDRPIRVLAVDGDVVMYDGWWPHLAGWGLANLDEIRRRRVTYHVTTGSALLEKATYLRLEPLTDAELALHRPDLPFAVARCETLSWPAQAPGSIAASAERWRAAGASSQGTLAASQVYLFPFGPKGGERTGVRVRADNGTSFGVDELVWQASVIQAPLIGAGPATPVRGVGIYRSGLHRGIPAYYLYGARSRMHGGHAATSRQPSTD